MQKRMKKYSIGVLLGLGIITTLLLLAANRTPLESPPKHRANRLIHEKSPYLLQHAYNPVNWYPWGDEAFTQARKEKKVIFLSIGYSTCYWCHVMEREIFENEELAALLNASFISIKVDREERPDVDRVYMAALQAMTGSGGWPMSLFVTPNLKPFFGATYIPPDRFGVLLKRIQEIWTTDPDQVKQSSQRLIEFLKKQAVVTPSTAPLEKSSLTKAFETLKRGYDETYAGFGSGPKFPRPVTFNFLLRYYKRFGDRKALDMTLETLKRMAEGGIYDHLGGGFHRYSVDGQWRVPHFEKMLYDQAQLVESYLDAYQITHELYYANIARETLAYVLRRMTDPQGGFYSAEDAESALDPEKPKEKEEGAFYVWTQEQIDGVLEKRQSEIFDYAYGVQPSGNALSDPQKVFVKKNILYRNHTIEEIAKRFNITEREATTSLRDSRARLFERREKRPQPHLDDKILVSWNGLMISAFARAYQVLDDPTYLSAAVKSADFILEKLYQPATKQLLRRYRDGEARFPAHLKDYAFFVMGLLDLYEADFDIRWLQMGRELTERQNRLLFDEKVGGFFDSSSEDRSLLFRTKEDYDGAEPSGNAIAISNLLRIAEMTNNRQFRTMADQTLSLFGERLANRPQAMPQMLVAMDFHLDKPKQIMIAGRRGQKDTKRMLKEIHKRYIPNKIVLLADGDRGQEFLSRNIPFIQSVKMIGNLATAYICENYSCKLPTPDLTAMGRLLDEER